MAASGVENGFVQKPLLSRQRPPSAQPRPARRHEIANARQPEEAGPPITAAVPGPNPRARDLAVSLVLVAAVVGTILATRPLAGVPLNDDFSYARTAQALAQQGRVAYNGWGSPMLWPQLAWGALVIKGWGFSWNALAVTGIVAAAITTFLMYHLARACGCSRLTSTLATATLTLNPIFLGVAPSYMSDVPSLLLLLLPLLVLVTSLDNTRGTLRLDPRRFFVSVALGVVAGANRQINWVAYLGALLAVMTLVPGERRRVGLGAGVVIGFAALGTLWFNSQKYTLPADVTEGLLVLLLYTNVALMFVYKILNMIGLFLFPLGLLAVRKRDGRNPVLVSLIVFFAIPVFYPLGTKLDPLHPDYRLTVYGQYFTSAGVVVGGVWGFQERPLVLPAVVVRAFVVGGVVGSALAVFLLIRGFQKVRQTPKEALQATEVAVAAVASASLAAFVAWIPWFAVMNVFDRYVLLFLPGLLILLGARATRTKLSAPLVGLAACLLAGMWVIGYGFVAEYMNSARARAALYHRLLGEGVPRRQIEAGFELNADTQVQTEGYVNNRLIVNPPGAYRKDARAPYVQYGAENFPALDPHYLLSTQRRPDPAVVWPEPVHATTYESPLFPPRRRSMYVYRIRR